MNTTARNSEVMHVFFVISHISFRVCQAIINLKGLSHDNVIIVSDRAYIPPTDFQWFPAPMFTTQSNKSLRTIPKLIHRRRKAKNWIAKISNGRKIELYINRSNQDFFEHFYTHPLTDSFNYYEEGFAAYYKELYTKEDDNSLGPEKFAHKFLYLLIGRPWATTNRFYIDGYKEAFSSSELAFRDFPRRVIVDVDGEIKSSAALSEFDYIERDAMVFALPLFYKFRGDAAKFERLLEAVVRCIQISEGNIYFKYHPDRYDDQKFIEYLRYRVREATGVDMKEKALAGLPLEELASVREDVIIVVIVSSLSVYSRFFRARVLSFAKPVFGLDYPLVRELIANSPKTVFVGSEDSDEDINRALYGDPIAPPEKMNR